jgi:hypothetical protein
LGKIQGEIIARIKSTNTTTIAAMGYELDTSKINNEAPVSSKSAKISSKKFFCA